MEQFIIQNGRKTVMNRNYCALSMAGEECPKPQREGESGKRTYFRVKRSDDDDNIHAWREQKNNRAVGWLCGGASLEKCSSKASD